MFEIVLFEPEIPPNTGNIMRLCANVGARLHLIEPLGFNLSDKGLKRAGLDYGDAMHIRLHASLDACERTLAPARWYAVSTRGRRDYAAPAFRSGDAFLFGPETRGLPEHVLATFEPERVIRLPMVPASRSLNLANAVAVVVYEAWRQNRFAGSSA